MTAHEILTQAKKAGLSLWLASSNGSVGIAYSDKGKIKPFIPYIKANRQALVKLLRKRLPVVPNKRTPGAITLELSRQWLNANKSPDHVAIAVPSKVRWLAGWLPRGKKWQFQLNTEGGDDGRLGWCDWNAACEAVEAEHQQAVKATGGHHGITKQD